MIIRCQSVVSEVNGFEVGQPPRLQKHPQANKAELIPAQTHSAEPLPVRAFSKFIQQKRTRNEPDFFHRMVRKQC